MARNSARAAAPQADSNSSLVTLHEDALVALLRAAKAAGVLGTLASSNKQLCSLARSRLPVQLHVLDQAQAALLLRSMAAGRPPFSGCTLLHITAVGKTNWLMAVNLLGAARQWSALEELQLCLHPRSFHPWSSRTAQRCSAGVLSMVPMLQQLRSLKLAVECFDACSAWHVAQAAQLTELAVRVEDVVEDAAPDLTALSRLTNLHKLHLVNPAVKPAAGPSGPFSLPSSVTRLSLVGADSAAPLAGWVTHLPGCPQLQHLEVYYGTEQHASAHPSAVFRLLAKHNKQLRSLMVVFASDSTQAMHWGAPVAGLPDAAGPVEWEWRPDAALAGLRGLEELDAATQLFVRDGGDWQHLVQLAAMTKLVWVEVHYAPPLLLPSPQQQQQQQLWRWLSLMELEYCWSSLDGHGLGRLLLACPALQRACIAISKPSTPGALPALPAAGEPLPPHSSLKEMQLHSCCHWGSAAAAAAHWAALAPVLSGVPAITIHEWPLSSSSSSSSSSPAGGRMPDLAPCTAVSTLKLCFECSGQPAGVQEDFLAMLAPLVQLKQLGVQRAAWLNARNVVTLQYMLPQLQLVQLVGCGSLLPAAAGGPAQQQEQQQEGQQQHAGEEQEPVQPEKQAQQQQEQDANEEAEQQVLGKVMQLLRPGLCLEVSTYPQSVKDGEQQAAAPDGTSSGTTSISTSYTSSGSGSSSSSSSSSDAEGGSSK